MRWVLPVFALLFAAATAGCVEYTPDSLLHRQRKWAIARTIGCLDVATEIVRDSAVPESSTIVDVTFGNRCTKGVHVDLARVQVFARYHDGLRKQLTVYDPKHEIETKQLAPAAVGRELLEFDPKTEETPPTHVCVLVSGIDADRAGEGAPPMCFTAEGDAMLPTSENAP